MIIIEDNKKKNEIVKYKNFILDPFQIDAIKSIEKGNSVVVSAGTGTGKTLIADYLIDKFLREKKRVIYTSPIKALSNQKFRDFRKLYGEAVGLLTGDVTINHDAQIQIMTTEIYRNMLLNKEYFDDLSYVIFDEVHYINDPERGAIWEESIIFSPENVRFLCLSATIPNAEQFANWIKKIHKHDVDVIIYNKRAVPLEHYVYTDQSGIKSVKNFDVFDFSFNIDERKRKKKQRYAKANLKNKQPSFSNIEPLVKLIKSKNWFPGIVFSFSRKKTWNLATKISQVFDFTTDNEKDEIARFFDKKIDEDLWNLDSVNLLRSLLIRGIGVHNAGLLPVLKEIVEVLFADGKIRMLFATETFALGINMPARCVVFTDLRKWDGVSFRNLLAREYFQMAGRAGRRGIDKKGYVISMLESTDNYYSLNKLLKIKSEPIVSQFQISYNTILNLVRDLDVKNIKKALKMSLYFYQNKNDETYKRLMTLFMKRMKELEKYGFIKDGKLTEKGMFGTKIYSNEIALTELIYDDIIKALTDKELLIVIASLIYEYRFSDRFNTKNINKEVKLILNKLNNNDYLRRKIKKGFILRMYKLVSYWYNGREFDELLNITNLAEGDIIRLFRQMIDVLRQLIKASELHPELIPRFEELLKRIDRDVINISY